MKFKIGDSIVPVAHTPDGLERTVIGHMRNGYVVYEYPTVDGNARLCSGAEQGFKLKPTKKEGWIIVGEEMRIPGARYTSYIYPTKELAEEKFGPGIFVKVEWEE